ncbi:g11199 [Coccomyxa elongata]
MPEQAAKFKDVEAMHIVYTVCGETVKPEFLMSLKSLYLFAVSSFVRGPSFYHIHVLSDGVMQQQDLAFLRPRSNFKTTIHPTYPNSTTLFKQCSTERIYLHQHADFQGLDQVVYVDTDTLWLDDATWWWTHFAHLRGQQAAFGLAEETNSGGSWYTNAPIPHYGARGLNAGVLMASLAAVRASTFTVERDAIIDYYSPQGHLPLGDQDVLNIYGHYHPDQMYVMPCIFNFRYDSSCNQGQPVLVHGNRALKEKNHTSYNHLYTFFSKIGQGITASATNDAGS